LEHCHDSASPHLDPSPPARARGSASGQAATPAAGTLTGSSGPVTYSAGPFLGANATPVPLVTAGPTCIDPVQPCDSFALTVNLPAGYKAAIPARSSR
jgi:hypothetical protein